MADRGKSGVPVPAGRAARLLRFGSMAGGIAAGMAAGGARALAQGRRPDLPGMLLTPGNSRRLTEGLSHLRGAALKLGQMLSMDTGVLLPPEVTTILSHLREDAHPMPPKQLQAVLDAEWGPGWYRRFARFDLRPFAAASIGQVHRAVLPDGQTLAIKVQYPGVRASIDSDVDNLGTLLRVPGLVPRGMDLAPLLAEAKRQLHAEADYTTEAQNLSQFAQLLTGSEHFTLPGLQPDLCTPQVLAMTHVAGAPLETLDAAPQSLRDRCAAALIDLVLQELFVFGAMQTDPNLANYRYQPETGRIVLLDFGAVQPIAPALREDFRHLARVALTGGAEETRAALLRIGYIGPDTAPRHQEVIQQMFVLAMAPLRQQDAFDFGQSDLLDRLHRIGLALGSERDLTHVPPAATLFLHRKIGGMYLLAARLRARVALRPMIEAHCFPSQTG